MSINNNEKAYQRRSVSSGRFHKHDPKIALLSVLKVMRTDSCGVMHNAGRIIQRALLKRTKQDRVTACQRGINWADE